MNNTYKVGDRVRIRTSMEHESRLSDLESDMQLDLADRCLEGKDYDTIREAIERKSVWLIIEIEDEELYRLQLEGSEFKLQYPMEEQILEIA